MSHDESLHAYYSYRYADLGEFRHDPLLHGPFLFHVQALVFALLGDGDATARLLPAIAGVLLVGAPWLFRRELGRRGAFAAGALLLLSPAVAVYSRYLRNDVWCALFALLWARALLDYRQRGEPRALRWLALAMALSFASQGGRLPDRRRLRRRSACSRRPARSAAAPRPGATAAGSTSRCSRRRSSRPTSRRSRSSRRARIPSSFDAPGAAGRAALWGGLLGAAALALALLRCRGSRSALARPLLGAFALFWGILLPLYTSLGTNLGRGLASGVAGSLGYWLAQHGVERGGQPVFFYVLLMALYEPLVWALSVAGGILAWRRYRGPSSTAAAAGEENVEATALRAALDALVWRRLARLLARRRADALAAGAHRGAERARRRLVARAPAARRPRRARAAAGRGAGHRGRPPPCCSPPASSAGDAAPAAELVRAVLLAGRDRLRADPGRAHRPPRGARGGAPAGPARPASAPRYCSARARRSSPASPTPSSRSRRSSTRTARRRSSRRWPSSSAPAGGSPAASTSRSPTTSRPRGRSPGTCATIRGRAGSPRARARSPTSGRSTRRRSCSAMPPTELRAPRSRRLARASLSTCSGGRSTPTAAGRSPTCRGWWANPASLRRAVAFYFFRELPGIPLEPWPLRKGAALYLPDRTPAPARPPRPARSQRPKIP